MSANVHIGRRTTLALLFVISGFGHFCIFFFFSRSVTIFTFTSTASLILHLLLSRVFTLNVSILFLILAICVCHCRFLLGMVRHHVLFHMLDTLL